MLVGALVVALIVGAALRTRRIETLVSRVAARRRLGADRIVVGGEGFTLARAGSPAVLLLHGAGDTPQTLRYLGEFLHARGFHVEAPLLPGHGRSVRDFMHVRADDLTDVARTSYAALRASHPWVGVIGLSMGGALAVQVAGETPDLPALGLAAPYLELPPRISRAARLSRLWGLVMPVVDSSDGVSILDPAEREKNLAYGVFTAQGLRALEETVRRADAALPRVVAPTLVLQSREDNRISVDAASRAFARLGAREKQLDWLTGTAHVITVDYGREQVFERLASWMETHGAARLIR